MKISELPRKNDKYIPWLFVAFFAVVFAVDGLMVSLALKTHTGVVTEKAYETGLNYNRILEDKRKQENLGWHLDMRTNSAGHIEVVAKDKDQTVIVGAKANVYLFRPTQEGFDQTVSLIETQPGHYQATPNYPLKGQWQAFVTIEKDGHIFEDQILFMVANKGV
jgi:nitrogen fixation protein FixH